LLPHAPLERVDDGLSLDGLELDLQARRDVCSFRYGASGGSSDPNCGDEYNNAYDDFMNFGWYGCGG
jgi:hypothetical protein